MEKRKKIRLMKTEDILRALEALSRKGETSSRYHKHLLDELLRR